MREKITESVEIPKGIEIDLAYNKIIVQKGQERLERNLKLGNLRIDIKKQDSKVLIGSEKATKREKKLIGTIVAHIKNMIKGLQDKFVYKLQICFIHFPATVSVEKEKNEIIIKNFLGERKPRIAKILPNVEVKIEKDIIIIESFDKEAAGQTAGNIEKSTKVKARDRRIFQDGCYIIDKPKKEK